MSIQALNRDFIESSLVKICWIFTLRKFLYAMQIQPSIRLFICLTNSISIALSGFRFEQAIQSKWYRNSVRNQPIDVEVSAVFYVLKSSTQEIVGIFNSIHLSLSLSLSTSTKLYCDFVDIYIFSNRKFMYAHGCYANLWKWDTDFV